MHRCRRNPDRNRAGVIGASGHGDGRRERRVRHRSFGRVGGAGRARVRPRRRADAQLRRERHRDAQLDLQVPRGGLPELVEVRGRVPGSDHRRARPELPVVATDPRRGQRGDREQRVARAPKHLWTDQGEGEPIVRFQGDDEHDEAAFVVARDPPPRRPGALSLRRHRGLLPHERAEPRHGRSAGARRRSRTACSAA